ncbi:MAG: hypothetical protein MUD12_01955 [Spirochaetes bacterium]|nr:hypothetical protein [Spirochaetota bacterium]
MKKKKILNKMLFNPVILKTYHAVFRFTSFLLKIKSELEIIIPGLFCGNVLRDEEKNSPAGALYRFRCVKLRLVR